MYSAHHVYSLDIETDNSEGHGLDPRRAEVTEISVLTELGGQVFAGGDEATLLREAGEFLTSLQPGLIATWNGTFFDMPYLGDRMARYPAAAKVAPRLLEAPGLKPKYEPLPGHAGGYLAWWDSAMAGMPHAHLDVSLAYKKFAADAGVPWSLKPVCKAAGITMVELDRTRLHEYTAEERHDYVLSDTVGTRELALRLLGLS